MGRTALPRKRIYRETVEEIIKKNGIKKTDFCEAMGHTKGWFAATLTKGYYDISVAGLRLWALALGCTEDELTALPVSPEGQKTASISPNGNNLDDVLSEIQALTAEVAMGFKTIEKDRPTETKQDELYDLVRSVAKMLHTDLMTILAYLKGKEKTE